MSGPITGDLVQRLSEAEATIAALLAGQIDAIVDPTTRTPVLLAKAQDALREERDRAERYLDAPQVILLALDLEQKVTLVNRYACSLLGFSAEDLVGRDWIETCLPPRVQDKARRALRTALEEDHPVTESWILPKMGGERLIEWRSSALTDEGGRAIGTFNSGSDITERRQTELNLAKTTADLLERNDRLERQAVALTEQASVLTEQAALLDLAQDAIIVRDMNMRIVFWNRGAEEMYGWSAQEAVGKDKSQLLQSRFSGPNENIVHVLELKGRWEGELLLHKRDGTPVDVASRSTLQRGADGSPLRILTIDNDITKRKQAKAELSDLAANLQRHVTALAQSEERTNYALESARMGVWELDLKFNRLSWSPTLAPLFGLEPDQAPVTVDAFLALIHPDDRLPVQAAIGQSISNGSDLETEFRVVWPDGTMRWIAGRARVFNDGARKAARLIGIGADISDQKSLEAQLRQAQKMEAVGQLAGGVAHDFNNILTAILGYSEIVIATFGPQDRRRADMDEVIRAGRRAAELTRQLLAFSRKQILRPTAVDLNQMIDAMRKMLSRLIGEQVDLVTTLASDLNLVRADCGQLEQVLMNLVVNARDAMPSGGRLAIETANVELDASFPSDGPVRPGPYVMMAVSDSGTGMSEGTKQRLFEPFFTTKAIGKGTGLGLATVYGIIKQTGGHVWVHTEVSKGSSFKVYLPRISGENPAEKPRVIGNRIAAGTETLLVVEDEDAVRLLTCRILEEAGYRVFNAPNPQLAEAIFEQAGNRFDMLVTDIIMPGSSGPQLFAQLARQRPDLKVLFLSGYTNDMIERQGQLDPGIEFLQKPFTADALNRRVRDVLDG